MTGEGASAGFGPFSWAAWTAIGTGTLAVATWALAVVTWYLARRTQRDAREQVAAIRETAKAQVAAAEQAAKDQMAVAERMAKDHIHTLEEDLKARLLLHYETRWDSDEMIGYRVKLARLLEINATAPREYIDDDVPNFFESVGVLLRRGHLDTEMVSHVFGYHALRYGQALGRFMVEDQRVHDDPQLWTGFLYLFETLRKFDAEKLKRSLPDFPRDELIRFFHEETRVDIYGNPTR